VSRSAPVTSSSPVLDHALFFFCFLSWCWCSFLPDLFLFVFVRMCLSSFGRVFCICSSSCIVFLCRIWSVVVVGGGVAVVGGGFRVSRMVKRVLPWC
jgi:hypothetical protein